MVRIVRLDPAPALAGFGVITPAGIGTDALLAATVAAGAPDRRATDVAADLADICMPWAAALRRADRYGALGFAAGCLALRAAGVEPPAATDPEWGVAMGSAIGCWESNARHHRALRGAPGVDPSPAGFVRTVSNAVNGDISIAWRLGGPSATFVSGWTAGAEALIAAATAIANGRARRMLAGGVEAPEGSFREAHAAGRRRPGGDWLPVSLAEGAAVVLMDAGGAPGAPRLLAFARGRDRSGTRSLAELRRAVDLPSIRRLVIANTLPPETRARIEREAGDLDAIDLPERAGEIGAAGAVAAAALAAVRGERGSAGALIVARGVDGGLAILAVA